MRRALWLGVGLSIGALVVRAASKRAKALTPGGLAASARDSAKGIGDTVRTFIEDVREGMAEREAEIHAALAEQAMIDADWADPGRHDTPFEEGERY